MTRFPALPRLGLGVGLDLPWGGGRGFGREAARGGDVLDGAVQKFLAASSRTWSHAFFSWQPRDRAPPRLPDYAPAWDDLVSSLPRDLPRALHHTALDLGALAPRRRGELLDFTARLCERYDLRWVNEDVGLWTLDGRPSPYPLPPLLTDEGLRAAIAGARECQAALPVPLLLEFPGFSRGVSLVIGPLDAYDFFTALADGADAPVTLDTGHLLSWRWLRGARGEDLLDGLDRLPLDRCFEIHLSGCAIVADRFIDAHHGALLEAQLELLERLAPRCENLRAVTFEDPLFDDAGALLPSSARSLEALRAVMARSAKQAAAPPRRHAPPTVGEPVPPERGRLLEAALASLLRDPSARAEPAAIDPLFAGLDRDELDEAAGALRRMVLGRAHRGSGKIRDWYPRTIAAWLERHPDDESLERLAIAFCASPACASWREGSTAEPGRSIEEALHAFFASEDVGAPSVREEELTAALVKGLAVTPELRSLRPSWVRAAPGGCFAVTGERILHAALDGRYVCGELTALVIALLEGAPRDEAAERFGVSPAEASSVGDALRGMRLL